MLPRINILRPPIFRNRNRRDWNRVLPVAKSWQDENQSVDDDDDDLHWFSFIHREYVD